jgi:hypothetical protein
MGIYLQGGFSMADSEDEATIMRPREFFKSPQESKIIEEAQRVVTESERGEILDEARLRNQEDWSYLANKVVGAEGD